MVKKKLAYKQSCRWAIQQQSNIISRFLLGFTGPDSLHLGCSLKWPGAPFQLRPEPTVHASSYVAEMLVFSMLQVMPRAGNGSICLNTWPMDCLLSLTSDSSHHDGPACWAVDFPASAQTYLITTNSTNYLDSWLI